MGNDDREYMGRMEAKMRELIHKILFRILRPRGYVFDYGLRKWVKEPPGMYAEAMRYAFWNDGRR